MGKKVLVFGSNDPGHAGWWMTKTAGNRSVTVSEPFRDTEELYAHIHEADVVVNALRIDDTWSAASWGDTKPRWMEEPIHIRDYWAPQIAAACKAMKKPFIQLSSAWVYADTAVDGRRCHSDIPFVRSQPTLYWQMVEHMVRQQNPDALILRLPLMFSAYAENPITRAAAAGRTDGYINPKTGDEVIYEPVVENDMNAMIAVADDVWKSISGTFDGAWVDVLKDSHPHPLNVWPYTTFELHTWYEVAVLTVPAHRLKHVRKMEEKPLVRKSSTGRKFSVPNHRKVVAYEPCNEHGLYHAPQSHLEAFQNYRAGREVKPHRSPIGPTVG